MELYYENLISKDASLERLVDNLMHVVQGADEFVQAAGANLEPEREQEIIGRLARLKESCIRLKQRIADRAAATDQLVRRNPYPVIVVAFAVGAIAGAAIARARD